MTTAGGAPPAPCVFCDIAAGRGSAHVVSETADAVAFLDRSPVFLGHTLVVPRSHHVTLAELPPELVGSVMRLAQRIAAAMETPEVGAHGTFVAMNNRISQSVAHLHVHVVPRRRKDGLRGFFWPRTRYESDEAMAITAQRLRVAVAGLATIAAPDRAGRADEEPA